MVVELMEVWIVEILELYFVHVVFVNDFSDGVTLGSPNPILVNVRVDYYLEALLGTIRDDLHEILEGAPFHLAHL